MRGVEVLAVYVSIQLARQVLKALEGDKSGASVLALESLHDTLTNALRAEDIEPSEVAP